MNETINIKVAKEPKKILEEVERYHNYQVEVIKRECGPILATRGVLQKNDNNPHRPYVKFGGYGHMVIPVQYIKEMIVDNTNVDDPIIVLK